MAQSLSFPRILLLGVLLFVFGVGGVLAGHFVRRSLAPKPTILAPPPQSLLEKGTAFPQVSLTRENGETVGTHELRRDAGCVILFLDLACPPCGDMAQKWQAVLVSGELDGLRVFGVTNHPVAAIEGFKLDYEVAFPIFQDAGKVFRDTFEVNRFPQEVVVGASGTIRSVSYDATAPVDPAVLARLLADTVG